MVAMARTKRGAPEAPKPSKTRRNFTIWALEDEAELIERAVAQIAKGLAPGATISVSGWMLATLLREARSQLGEE